ncbi:MAG: plasmid recombination protein [Clostridiales bacterium]|nr:plasmid recombination protein [Clostridiales bacterium]
MAMCGILRIKSITQGGIGHIGAEEDRKHSNERNPDIDPIRTQFNETMYREPGISLYRAWQDKCDDLDIAPSRKGQIVMEQAVITASPEFFQGLDWDTSDAENGKIPSAIYDYFNSAADWAANYFGEKNIISMTLHLDETTPHMHIDYIPAVEASKKRKDVYQKDADGKIIKDNRGHAIRARDENGRTIYDWVDAPARLNRSDYWQQRGGRNSCRKMQDDFYKSVSSQYGLERGEIGSGRQHIEQQRYKAQQAAMERDTAIREREQEEQAAQQAYDNRKRAEREAQTARQEQEQAEKAADAARQQEQAALKKSAEIDSTIKEREQVAKAVRSGDMGKATLFGGGRKFNSDEYNNIKGALASAEEIDKQLDKAKKHEQAVIQAAQQQIQKVAAREQAVTQRERAVEDRERAVINREQTAQRLCDEFEASIAGVESAVKEQAEQIIDDWGAAIYAYDHTGVCDHIIMDGKDNDGIVSNLTKSQRDILKRIQDTKDNEDTINIGWAVKNAPSRALKAFKAALDAKPQNGIYLGAAECSAVIGDILANKEHGRRR